MRCAKHDLPWSRSATIRPARLTGSTPSRSTWPALRSRSASGAAQCVTGKRPPNGSRPCARKASSFSRRWRIRSLRSSLPGAPRLRLLPGSRLGPPGPEQVGLDERVEVAVQHGLDVADLEPRPVVLDQLIGLKRVRADLAAERDLLLLAGELRELLTLLLLSELEQARLEDPHRRVAVPELGALVLALDDDPRREVRDAHGGVGGVDPLPARSRRPEDVHADLVLAHAHLDVVTELRHALGDLAVEARVARLGGKLEHHAEVLGRGRELPDAGHRAGELGALPDELLGAPVVLPEGGRRHLGVERGEATLLGRDVKDAPGAHRRG